MNRRFIIGFISGLLIFTVVNLFAAHFLSDCGLSAVLGVGFCADDIVRVGWPLQFYEAGGFIFRHEFNQVLLFIDILIGNGFALGLGWLFARSKKALSK